MFKSSKVLTILVCTIVLSVSGLFPDKPARAQKMKSTKSETKNEISKEEAIKLAQQFIADNGYTNAKPDRTKFKKESLERASDVDKIFESRKNTLKPGAYGAKLSGGEWLVAFEYKKEPYNKNCGRAVLMNKFGANLRVAHQDLKLEAVPKSKK